MVRDPEGAIKYDPAKDRRNTVEPFTHITEVRLFYDKVIKSGLNRDPGQPGKLELDYNENHLTFDFIGISFRNPKKCATDINWKGPMMTGHL